MAQRSSAHCDRRNAERQPEASADSARKRGDAFSNTAESVFSILKRGLNGIYHSVSNRHLHRYLSEYEYRWNTREDRDSERMRKAVLMSEGKRLRYVEPAGA